jgi:hypothetical protein
MSPAWPDVAARLVEMFEAAGVSNVYYGQPVTADVAGIYATVGYVQDDAGGTYAVEPIYDGSQLLETGTVVCQVAAQTGESELEGVRADVFAVADAFQADVRADRTLGGVLSVDCTCTTDVAVHGMQDVGGAAQTLVISVNYTTRY